jgi:hypothetical protein
MPVYIESRDSFGYVENVSHNFSFGGQHTTDIQITAIRRKYLGDDPADASNFKSKNGSTKSFEIKGRPAILIHVKNASEVDALQGLSQEQRDDLKSKLLPTTKDKQNLADKIQTSKSNNFFKSNRNGEYFEFPLVSETAQAVLREAQQAKDNNNQDAYLNFLEKAIPVSDEEGYELIGSYENGRSLKLSANNSLDKKAKSFSELLAITLNSSKTVPKDFRRYNFQKSAIFIPESNSGTLSGREESENRASGSVRNFLDSKVQSLRKLSPVRPKSNSSRCSCFDANLTQKEVKRNNSGKNKPIKDI